MCVVVNLDMRVMTGGGGANSSEDNVRFGHDD